MSGLAQFTPARLSTCTLPGLASTSSSLENTHGEPSSNTDAEAIDHGRADRVVDTGESRMIAEGSRIGVALSPEEDMAEGEGGSK